jgi:hypothetical protein
MNRACPSCSAWGLRSREGARQSVCVGVDLGKRLILGVPGHRMDPCISRLSVTLRALTRLPSVAGSGTSCGSGASLATARALEKTQRGCASAIGKRNDQTRGGAEVHWYEAHGVGRKNMKIKQFLD